MGHLAITRQRTVRQGIAPFVAPWLSG